MEKVKFGLKNCYYAKITESGYATPVRLPGAVSLTLSPVGETSEFYADDALYFGEKVNNGYDGSLELALIPESFRKDCLGEVLDSNNVLKEASTAAQSNFALLFETTTDDGARKMVIYNCMAARPNIDANTKTASKEVQTETIELTCRPNADGVVRMKTTSTTPAAVVNAWYDAVYEEVASI